jgi:hypothetical protein
VGGGETEVPHPPLVRHCHHDQGHQLAGARDQRADPRPDGVPDALPDADNVTVAVSDAVAHAAPDCGAVAVSDAVAHAAPDCGAEPDAYHPPHRRPDHDRPHRGADHGQPLRHAYGLSVSRADPRADPRALCVTDGALTRAERGAVGGADAVAHCFAHDQPGAAHCVLPGARPGGLVLARGGGGCRPRAGVAHARGHLQLAQACLGGERGGGGGSANASADAVANAVAVAVPDARPDAAADPRAANATPHWPRVCADKFRVGGGGARSPAVLQENHELHRGEDWAAQPLAAGADSGAAHSAHRGPKPGPGAGVAACTA